MIFHALHFCKTFPINQTGENVMLYQKSLRDCKSKKVGLATRARPIQPYRYRYGYGLTRSYPIPIPKPICSGYKKKKCFFPIPIPGAYTDIIPIFADTSRYN